MKFPFVFASACLISGATHPLAIHAKTIATSSAEIVISDTRPPPTKTKASPNKDRAEKKRSKPMVDQTENARTPRPQAATGVAQEQASQRAKSFILLLQILQGAK